MLPIIRTFSDKKPRVYGTIALVVAIIIGYFGVWATTTRANGILAGTIFFTFALFAGLTGVLYVAFGRKANDWDDKFISTLNPNNIAWKPMLALTSLSLLILITAVMLAITLRHR
jgi:hypothetical protein